MDQTTGVALIGLAGIGMIALLIVLRRQREERDAARANQFAASTEGMKVCSKCGRPNLWADTTCMYCGSKLKG